MKHYRHLSVAEREEISLGLALGKSIRTIAKELRRSPSSIAREINRNLHPNTTYYRATSAQKFATKRRRKAGRTRKMRSGTWLWDEVVRLLRKRWSPDQIAAYLKETYPLDVKKHISHEAIYQSIYILPRGTLRTELTDCLRRSHRQRRKRRYLRAQRGQIPNLVSIHDRPKDIESRIIPGHWEGDLIIGKYHTSAIGTLVERTSRKVLICKLEGRTSKEVVTAFIHRLQELPISLRASLTYDRGKEMAYHEKITKMISTQVFFCDPYSPWQRGTNENTNGLIRDFFPKGTDFSTITAKELHNVEMLLNDRPRKCLQYRTPNEVFFSHLRVALGS